MPCVRTESKQQSLIDMQGNAIYCGSPKAFHVFFPSYAKTLDNEVFHVFKAKTILKVELYKRETSNPTEKTKYES